MATAVCAVRSVRLLTMTRSSLLALSVCVTVLLVIRPVIAEKDPTCLALQKNEEQIWALGLNKDTYMLITSTGNVFTDIPKSNLVKSGRFYTLTIDQQAKTFEDALPYAGKVVFGNHTTTKLFIADPSHMVVVIKKNFDGTDWNYSSLQAYSLVGGESVGEDEDRKLSQFKYTVFIVSNGVNQSFVKAFESDKKNKICQEANLVWQYNQWNVKRSAAINCFDTNSDDIPQSGMIIEDGSSQAMLLFHYKKDQVGIVDGNNYGKEEVIVSAMQMSQFIECTNITNNRDETNDDKTSYGSIIIVVVSVGTIVVMVFAYIYWRKHQAVTASRMSKLECDKKRRSYKASKPKVSKVTNSSLVFSVKASPASSCKSLKVAPKSTGLKMKSKKFGGKSTKATQASPTSSLTTLASNGSMATKTNTIVLDSTCKSKVVTKAHQASKRTALPASRKSKSSPVSVKSAVATLLENVRKLNAHVGSVARGVSKKIRAPSKKNK